MDPFTGMRQSAPAVPEFRFALFANGEDAMSRAIGPLASLDESALHELAPRGATRSFAKNAVIINEGDQTDSLYILLSGRAKVFVSEEDGREVVLSTIREGDYFGELVLDGGPRSASIMTLEPCRCFVIPLGDIEGLLERNPLFAGHLIHMLIGRVRSLVKKVSDLALKDVYGRFVKFIDENAIEQDGVRVVPERLTQHDIAARIGGSREMVSRIVKDLTAGGYVSVDAKQITVHKKLPAQW
jgi:CRP/FNR family cyclic AMP-dependent transcriptional regulator